MTQLKRAQILLKAETLQQIQARQTVYKDSVSEAGAECLERYFALLASARVSLKERFTSAELSALVDVHNGTLWEPHTLSVIRWSYADAEEEYDEKWHIDRAQLLQKLSCLTDTECAALVDAIERFWKASGSGIAIDPGKILE